MMMNSSEDQPLKESVVKFNKLLQNLQPCNQRQYFCDTQKGSWWSILVLNNLHMQNHVNEWVLH